MVKEHTHLFMVMSMKVSGKMEKWMDLEHSHGLMEINMLGNTKLDSLGMEP